MKQSTINKLLKNFKIKDFVEWDNVNADLIITDPPFGIKFDGKKNNYNRDSKYVVNGYIEWDKKEYSSKIDQLLDIIYKNLNNKGQALIFSGWNNSYIIHNKIIKFKKLELEGKLYWIYNFAPYCRRRPAHNVYEIFWITKNKGYNYNLKCNTEHCKNKELNLTSLIFKRDYKSKMPKYPTRLPFKLLQCLIEHFSNKGDLIFDPLAGSGMIGIVSYFLERRFILGDLNPNGKIVFESLLNYYIDKNNLFFHKDLSDWL
ncbi:MAG: DNA methyltransferase [Candidatus Helarchaeota archaeon]